jgi:hypothetical protein
MDKRTREYKESTRKRVPIGGRRTKLQLSQQDLDGLKDYQLRWINDQQGRIQSAEAGGYEFVVPEEAKSLGEGAIHAGNSDLGARVSKVVDRHGTRAYLMKIRKDWYQEDQLDKEKNNARVDEQLRPVTQGGQTVEGGYTPR